MHTCPKRQVFTYGSCSKCSSLVLSSSCWGHKTRNKTMSQSLSQIPSDSKFLQVLILLGPINSTWRESRVTGLPQNPNCWTLRKIQIWLLWLSLWFGHWCFIVELWILNRDVKIFPKGRMLVVGNDPLESWIRESAHWPYRKNRQPSLCCTKICGGAFKRHRSNKGKQLATAWFSEVLSAYGSDWLQLELWAPSVFTDQVPMHLWAALVPESLSNRALSHMPRLRKNKTEPRGRFQRRYLISEPISYRHWCHLIQKVTGSLFQTYVLCMAGLQEKHQQQNNLTQGITGLNFTEEFNSHNMHTHG